MDMFASLAPHPLTEAPAIQGSQVALLFLVAIVAVWVIVRSMQVRSARISEAWRDLSADLDMSYKPARGPLFRRKGEELEGVVEDVPVRLTRYGLSSKLDSAIYTRWTAELEDEPDFYLYVHKRHPLSRIAVLLGYEEIELGDPSFDKLYAVKSDEPDKARELLTAELREKIARLHGACILVNEAGLNVVWSGELTDAAELKGGLEVLKDLLRKFRGMRPKAEDKPSDAGPKRGGETPGGRN